MAKPTRKASKSKPITEHQLFPAVVALWFGALFGLGSLAVRPSLLEEFVIKSRIDLLMPAAAPPLGMTARMLIALGMAAFGATLGVWIAQRLARPKQEARERKRTTLSTRDEGAGNAYGAASTRNPGPASGEVAAPGVLAGRRRALAIEHDEGEFVPHDSAPLPGGAPQIFDIAAAGLNDTPPPLAVELGNYAEPAPVATSVALDWANAAPQLPPEAPAVAAPVPEVFAMQRQVFVADEPEIPVQPQFAPEPVHPPIQLVSEVQRQVFGAVPPTHPPVDRPRQIFGAPVTGDHVSKEFVESQGFRSSVFQSPEPTPLFPARPDAAAVVAAPAVEAPPAAIPQAYEPPVEVAAPAAPIAEGAPEAVLPSPASLGIEDLSSRLAESMRRRRAARAGEPVEPVVAPRAEIAPEPPVVAAPVAVPLAFEPSASPPLPEPAAAADTVPAFTVPSFTVPPFAVPVATTEAPVAAQPIPAALRPLDLTGFEEDDDAVLPPRSIAFAVEAAPAIPVPPPVAMPIADEPEVAEDVAVAEENYASLLGVAPSPVSQRNPFVRVEEAEADAVEIAPVVIFPGQAMPAANAFTAPAAEEATPFRRFDAPANAGHGQPIAANEAATAVPREEAELALRSALANLQRMSGAA